MIDVSSPSPSPALVRFSRWSSRLLRGVMYTMLALWTAGFVVLLVRGDWKRALTGGAFLLAASLVFLGPRFYERRVRRFEEELAARRRDDQPPA